MNTTLAPTCSKLIGEYWVLWYNTSNSYSVVDQEFKTVLDCYFNSDSIADFKLAASLAISRDNIITLIERVETYLNSCNILPKKDEFASVTLDTSHDSITRFYTVNEIHIEINFGSQPIVNLIHPALEHLCIKASTTVTTRFDIYQKDDILYLYQDKLLITAVPKKDYHLLQGKFVMQLLCTIHQKEEDDWIGTFHGSTLTDKHSSIMFVGASGKGKSTLCALLCANGFNLLADDVSPMLSKNTHIYHNPSAISIKAGANATLRKLIPNFDRLPSITVNKNKGPITYVPCEYPKAPHYPCHSIVLVNYQKNAETHLEKASIKTLLETLIPDSWISSSPTHAKQLLDWLDTVNIYELTYSDTESVTNKVSQLFNQYRVNA